MTTHRSERIADLVRHVLAGLLLKAVRDPRVGFVTVTDVKVSTDLKLARVFVSTLGDPTAREASVAALNHAAPFLKRALAKEVELRYIPDLRFFEDAAMEQGFRVETLLEEIRQDHEQHAESVDTTDGVGNGK